MDRFHSEDLHNSLLTSQDLAFSEGIHKKASHDQSVMMILKVVKLSLKSLMIIGQRLGSIQFLTQQVIASV